MMPNVNELHRLAMMEYEELVDKSFRLGLSKHDRNIILGRIRELEKELDIEPASQRPGVNG